MVAYSLVAVLAGAALFFNTREKKAGLQTSVEVIALVVLVLILAMLCILPAIWIW